MFTERVHIREEMENLRQEKIALKSLYREEMERIDSKYWQLSSRLRELDEKERESIDPESIIMALTDNINKISKLLPQIPADVLITHLSLLKENQDHIIIEESKTDNIHVDQESVRDQLIKDSIIKPKKIKDLKSVTNIVSAYLKEKRIPIKSSDIFDYLEKEHKFSWSKKSHGMLIKTFIEYDNKINRCSGVRGYYQYKI